MEAQAEGFHEGEQIVPVSPASGQECYDAELLAFLAAMKSDDGSSVEFPLEHELLVQETLLRITGVLEYEVDLGRARL